MLLGPPHRAPSHALGPQGLLVPMSKPSSTPGSLPGSHSTWKARRVGFLVTTSAFRLQAPHPGNPELREWSPS